MPDRKEKQDESHPIYFKNNIVACDGCSGSNGTAIVQTVILFAGIFLLTALLSYGFGLESSGECLKIVLAGFLFYLLPCTVEIVIAGIVFLAEWIRSFT